MKAKTSKTSRPQVEAGGLYQKFLLY